MHQNVQSLSNSVKHLEAVLEDLSNNQKEVIAMTISEHWMSEDRLTNYGIGGYVLVSYFCRARGKHGGSAIYVKKNCQYQVRNDIERLSN